MGAGQIKAAFGRFWPLLAAFGRVWPLFDLSWLVEK